MGDQRRGNRVLLAALSILRVRFAPPRESAGAGAPARVAEKPSRVVLSNRDKVFWPDEGFTKGDMLDYYAAISDTLLPHSWEDRVGRAIEEPSAYEDAEPGTTLNIGSTRSLG